MGLSLCLSVHVVSIPKVKSKKKTAVVKAAVLRKFKVISKHSHAHAYNMYHTNNRCGDCVVCAVCHCIA